MILEAQEVFWEWKNVEEMLNQLRPNENLNTEQLRQRLFHYTSDVTDHYNSQ
jgi:hypothetical protein